MKYWVMKRNSNAKVLDKISTRRLVPTRERNWFIAPRTKEPGTYAGAVTFCALRFFVTDGPGGIFMRSRVCCSYRRNPPPNPNLARSSDIPGKVGGRSRGRHYGRTSHILYLITSDHTHPPSMSQTFLPLLMYVR